MSHSRERCRDNDKTEKANSGQAVKDKVSLLVGGAVYVSTARWGSWERFLALLQVEGPFETRLRF